jgi:ABC-type nitrate/sulfonate/bicarbonate transport system permease component
VPDAPDPPLAVNPSPDATAPAAPGRPGRSFSLRRPIPAWQAILLGISCVLACLALWWFVTRGEAEERLVGPLTLPSPAETFGTFPRLWFEQELTRNILATLRRVTLGFLLAVLVGVPLGILAGCFPRVNAFLTPIVMFGRNIPIAALLPLLILVVQNDFIFSATEQRKILFIFVASAAFILADTARAISDVAQRYVDTGYTLGASRWQTIKKVLIPLAAPTIFSSCRLMFGIAFGYIMLAESIKEAGGAGGLGFQIQTAQRRGDRETIYLIILIIPVIALVIDQFLYWVQRSLFPYVYPSDGLLRHVVRFVMHGVDDLKRMVLGSRVSDAFLARHYPAVEAAEVRAATAAAQASGAPASAAPDGGKPS